MFRRFRDLETLFEKETYPGRKYCVKEPGLHSSSHQPGGFPRKGLSYQNLLLRKVFYRENVQIAQNKDQLKRLHRRVEERVDTL